MKWLLFAAAGLLAASGSVGVGVAQDKAIIVLDGSGSMWGQIEGRPKLEIARETLRDVLAGVPESLELGLMAYGHREKGSCGDIELIVPPAAGTAPAISEAAGSMRFLGKTPLSDAVQQAADALRYTEDKATVILITDGIETCEADPCALGLSLEQSGVDFTAHVVGFGLSREEGRSVACLAENTGGEFILAEDGAALEAALGETVATVTEEPAVAEAPVAPVELPEATVSAEDPVAIGSAFVVTWTGPGEKQDYVAVVGPGDAEGSVRELSYSWLEPGKDALVRAPGEPGTYQLRYVWRGPDESHVLAEVDIEVIEAPASVSAPATVAVGQDFEVSWTGPGEDSDYVDLVPEGYAETSGELAYAYVREGGTLGLRAPGEPGRYQLRYVLQAADGREVLASAPLQVDPATSTLAFPPTAVVGTELTVHWTGPGGSNDYVDLVPEGYADTSGELAYGYVAVGEEAVSFRVPTAPGRYDVRYVLQASNGRQVLATGSLEVTDAVATLDAPAVTAPGQTFPVGWTGPEGVRGYVDIAPADVTEPGGELTYFYTDASPGGQNELTAPDTAGRYAIRFVLEGPTGARILASEPLTVQ